MLEWENASKECSTQSFLSRLQSEHGAPGRLRLSVWLLLSAQGCKFKPRIGPCAGHEAYLREKEENTLALFFFFKCVGKGVGKWEPLCLLVGMEHGAAAVVDRFSKNQTSKLPRELAIPLLGMFP